MDIESIIGLLDEINSDRTVPRNIREMVSTALKNLRNEKQDVIFRVNNVISLLDEVSNDPNIPTYTRTQVWNIVSMLESISSGR
ncbi:MAG: UPF0147 family protein [Candidatus Aenigmarchaeota archaeon]|nr:UPF0147 family protein [Candidatus Aenigmarchaeota archaeon]